MSDTTRMLIGFILIMLVLFVWQIFISKPRPVQPTSSPFSPKIAETTHPAIKVDDNIIETAPRKTSSAVIAETTVMLETNEMRLVFSSYGASIKSVFLKKYSVELVPNQTLILETPISINQNEVNNNWSIRYKDDSTVVFQNFMTKSYKLHKDYVISLKIADTNYNRVSYQIVYSPGLALTESNIKDELKHFMMFYQSNDKIKKLSAAKLKLTQLNNVLWVGLKSKYFTSIFASKDSLGMVSIYPLRDGRIGYTYQPSRNHLAEYIIYFGPLEYDILKKFHLGWETIVDWGWTKAISLIILRIFKFLYNIFKNYGIAIIFFSILMKLIFFPLSRMSMKQMRQMQLLQPKLEELKRKYKDDPQTLNRETMQLYRLYKINPFSGCLPLIVQLPIFWALYSVLQKTIELRQAQFAFWIKDLSVKDPYYILPILMGVSFLIQNFLTSTDKRNMVLLIFMPIFLTVIFLNFPSGLQLYWLFFNLLSIVESLISRGGVKWKKLSV
ncbi:MAG: membrane protein insertase YidC [candidate division WOR-3 bacterium]|nr:membrane protein insertase YidC [candidate division WOR-3 bacterium]